MKHIYKHITVLMLVFALVVSAAPVANIAKAVDLDSPCTLLVHTGGSEYEDLQEAEVLIDLYKVADAVPMEGYDAYTYSNLQFFNGLELENVQDSETWVQLAKEASEIIYNNYDIYPACSGRVDEDITDIEAGLYLLVAHGVDDDSRVKPGKDDKGNDIYTSSVTTPTRKFIYYTVLVSLPGKSSDDTNEWSYNDEIFLKPEPAGRFGSLEIIKNLANYVDGCPATFVFQIEAVIDGENVYSDVVSVSFDDAGTNSVLIEDIPIGAVVTVTEVYTGVCYRLVTEETQTAVVDAEQTVYVEFTNEDSGFNNNGGGITNSFEYDKNTGWSWEKISHS